MQKEKDDEKKKKGNDTLTQGESKTVKKTEWKELEISGCVRNISSKLWTLQHLTALYLHGNNLLRIPPEISKLKRLTKLDLSHNKLRSLPSEIGDMLELRELLLNNNNLRILPNELGRLFQLKTLGLQGNPLPSDILSMASDSNGVVKLITLYLDSLTGN